MSLTLEIGNIVVPRETFLEFDQEYEMLEAADFARLADGTGVLRTAWTGKLRTLMSGKGWAASAFAGLAQGAVYTLKCAAPLPVDGTTTSITLPTARRSDTDHEPVGYAHTADGRLVETPITGIVSNVATLTAVDNALGYRVEYLPQVSVVILRNTCKYAQASNDFAWSIEAEQV